MVNATIYCGRVKRSERGQPKELTGEENVVSSRKSEAKVVPAEVLLIIHIITIYKRRG